mmetsp:Transcript_24732/g.40549  ORF Transcript_24732/g.40549 Transcript_24732/m.40549 type:complete len:118 (-) Transcript_24732:12-365(-)
MFLLGCGVHCNSCTPYFGRCEKDGCNKVYCGGCCNDNDHEVDCCEDCEQTFCSECRFSECSRDDWVSSCPGCLKVIAKVIPQLAKENETQRKEIEQLSQENKRICQQIEELTNQNES